MKRGEVRIVREHVQPGAFAPSGVKHENPQDHGARVPRRRDPELRRRRLSVRGLDRGLSHPEGRDEVIAAHGDRLDLLLGRFTYDLWSGYWPKAPSGPLADGLNAATKYVVTHRPESLAWGPFEAVGPDIVEGVRRIKSQAGPDLVLWGSSTVASTLIEHGLADELVLMVYPVLVGAGKRLFTEGTSARSFELVSTKPLPSGIIFSTYKIAEPLKSA